MSTARGDRWFRGSWIVALVIAVSAMTWQILYPHEAPVLTWQAALLLAWLALASWLIVWGRQVTAAFEWQGTVLCGRAGPWHGLAERILSARSLLGALPLIVGADAAVILAGGSSAVLAFRLMLATATFYYAATGFRGCLLAAQCVAALASAADAQGRLNYFHPDRLAGLAFARDFADRISIFMLSGAAALPMAVLASTQAPSAQPTGIAARVLIGTICAAWGIIALAASLRGRIAIAAAVDRLRLPVMNDIAEARRRLVDDSAPSRELELWAAREKAVLAIHTGVFTEMGGWRDLFAAGAGGLAVWRIIASG
jgi:hypothetical protein